MATTGKDEVSVEFKAVISDIVGKVSEVNTTLSEMQEKFKQISELMIVGFSLHGLYDLTEGAIEAASQLNEMSKRTGIAVEALGGIGFAASKAGGSLESAVAATGKLNRSIAEAAAGNKEAYEPFLKLGVAITDTQGKAKSADAVMIDLADQFKKLEDGPEKTALAIKIFGRAGAELIPLLDAGGKSLQNNIKYYKKYGGVTAEVAESSNEFHDKLADLHLISGAFGRTLAADLLPTLHTLSDELLRLKEGSDLFQQAAAGMTAVFKALVTAAANVIFVFVGIGREIGAVAAQTVEFIRQLANPKTFDLTKFHAISDAVKADGVRARAELDKFVSDLWSDKNAPKKAQEEEKKSPAPRLSGTQDEAQRKAQLALQKAADEASLNQELQYLHQEDVISQANFDQNLIDLKKYYDQKLETELEGINASIRLKKKEAQEAAADAKRAQDSHDVVGRIEALTREEVANGAVVAMEIKKQTAILATAEAYRKQAQARDNALANVNFDSEKAAADHRVAMEKYATDQLVALRKIDNDEALKQQLEQQAESYAATQKYLAEKRSLILNDDKQALAQQALAEQNAERENQRKITEILNASAKERAAETIKVQQGVQDGFAQMLNDLMGGTKRLSDAFRGFAISVASQFQNLIAQDFAKRLFGGGSSGGGVIDSLTAPIISGLKKMASIFFGTQTEMTAATVAGATARTGTEVAAQSAMVGATVAGATTRVATEASAESTSIIIIAAGALKRIAIYAWTAAAAVYKSIADIPYVGPFLAPAAAIAAGVAVLAFGKHISSAEGGWWQIPGDQIAQVHKNEMVLPAKEAQGIRDVVSGRGGQQQAPVVLGGVSAGDFFIASKKELQAVLNGMARDFRK